MTFQKRALVVLFTSVGRRVMFLRQVRAAAQSLGIRALIIGTDIDPLASALSEVDVAVKAPRSDSAGYVEFLDDLCAAHGVSIVVPLTDPDARILSEQRDRLTTTERLVAAVAPQMADVIDDKWATTEFFRSCDVDVPPCWLAVPDAAAGLDLLVKPRRGSAGKGIFAIDADFSGDLPADSMVQQRVEGVEITVDVSCGVGGLVESIGMRRRIEVRSGEVSKAVTVFEPEIENDVVRIATGLGARGPITVQCFITDDGPKFIEINGRVGGGIPLSIEAGSRTAELLLGLAGGLGSPGIARAEPGVFMTRFDDQVFLRGLPWSQGVSGS